MHFVHAYGHPFSLLVWICGKETLSMDGHHISFYQGIFIDDIKDFWMTAPGIS
jgi:hypothetical protein